MSDHEPAVAAETVPFDPNECGNCGRCGYCDAPVAAETLTEFDKPCTDDSDFKSMAAEVRRRIDWKAEYDSLAVAARNTADDAERYFLAWQSARRRAAQRADLTARLTDPDVIEAVLRDHRLSPKSVPVPAADHECRIVVRPGESCMCKRVVIGCTGCDWHTEAGVSWTQADEHRTHVAAAVRDALTGGAS